MKKRDTSTAIHPIRFDWKDVKILRASFGVGEGVSTWAETAEAKLANKMTKMAEALLEAILIWYNIL